jgi:uncharacterized membrane protein
MTEPTERPGLPGHIEASVRALAELHAEHHRQAPRLQRVVDRAVRLVGRPRFVAWLSGFVALWIVFNLGLGRFGFDAPPFPILQGIAQLAALYITVLILITQLHKTELTDHREQLTLELVMLSEQKSAKIVELIEEMRRDSPMIKNRVDAHADALAVPADPQQVLDAIKEKHGEMLASVDAEIAGRGAGSPDGASKAGGG